MSTRETSPQAPKALSLRDLRSPVVAAQALDLAAGECVAVMGASGSGKSKLLRAIADLDPNEGRLSLDGQGRESFAAPEWRRRVAYVPAESGWWAETVGAHFAAEAPCGDLLASVGLSQAALDWQVTRLSTGERQRLALLRALILEPKVLLLDEPTSGLDADATAQVEKLLQDQMARGAAILLVTHDPAQAARLASRRFRMESGRLLEDEAGAAPAGAASS